jgi:hypothetical protein
VKELVSVSYMREQIKEWENTSHVTIPLEYFDHLRERDKVLRELLNEIERCFHYDRENERTIVNVERIVRIEAYGRLLRRKYE